MSHPFEILEDLFSGRHPLLRHAEKFPAVARALEATDAAIVDFKVQIADAFYMDWKREQTLELEAPPVEVEVEQCGSCEGEGCMMCVSFGGTESAHSTRPNLELIEGGHPEGLESPSLSLVVPEPAMEPERPREATGRATEVQDTLVPPEKWAQIANHAALKWCSSRPEWRDECAGAVLEKFSAEYPRDMREANMMAKHAVVDRLRELGGRKFQKNKTIENTVPINHTGHLDNALVSNGSQGYRGIGRQEKELVDPHSDDTYRDVEVRLEIEQAVKVSKLTVMEKGVLDLILNRGLNHREVAEQMGFTESRSSQLLSQARQKLVEIGGLEWMRRKETIPKWLMDRGLGGTVENQEVPKVVETSKDDVRATRVTTTKPAVLQQTRTPRQNSFTPEMAERALGSIKPGKSQKAILEARATGLSALEIAEYLDLPPASVHNAMSRAKKAMGVEMRPTGR